jgi:dihydrofolate synthase/folylpolyglutamate synthase
MDRTLPTRIETYSDAIRWLYDRIDYERIRPSGQINPFRLERIEMLLQRIGSPHRRIPAVHIAGTKGKGSTAAMLSSILQASGLRTGLFTSPHMNQFEERMQICGRMPHPDQLTQLVARLCEILQSSQMDVSDRIPTFFEVATLLAWMLFDQEHVRIAVLETGLGGRLDCTNVCWPLVTVITSIGLDHTHILGDTLSKIAWEKAGILKAGVPVVQGQLPGDADMVVAARARELACRRLVCGQEFAWHADQKHEPSQRRQRSQRILVLTPSERYDLEVPLLGEHQAHNASLAVMAAELLRDQGYAEINAASISSGIRATHWPLRFEVFDEQPSIVLDAAHNPDSVRAVVRVLEGAEWKNRPRVLMFAASADKDARTMLQSVLPHFDNAVLTRFLGNPRSRLPEELFAMAESLASSVQGSARCHQASDPRSALALARELAGNDGVVCVTGSLFLAAEARGLLVGNAK